MGRHFFFIFFAHPCMGLQFVIWFTCMYLVYLFFSYRSHALLVFSETWAYIAIFLLFNITPQCTLLSRVKDSTTRNSHVILSSSFLGRLIYFASLISWKIIVLCMSYVEYFRIWLKMVCLCLLMHMPVLNHKYKLFTLDFLTVLHLKLLYVYHSSENCKC